MKQGLSKDKAIKLLQAVHKRISAIEYVLCAAGIVLNNLVSFSLFLGMFYFYV